MRTAAVARLIAHHLFLPPEEKDLLRAACLLHHHNIGLLAPESMERVLADIFGGSPPVVTEDGRLAGAVRGVLNAYNVTGTGRAPESKLASILWLANAFDQNMQAPPIEGEEVGEILDRLREGMDSLDGFLLTFSGLRFWPLDPIPEKILIGDIAHALAHQCRFGGHASKFYSVAEHSVHVSQLCLPEHALWGLLKDASKAYLFDLPSPLKQLPEFAAYREAERRLQRAVATRFGLPENQPASVAEADHTMLWIEAHSLLDSTPHEAIRDMRPPFEIADPLPPVEAERLFLVRFKELSA